VRGGRSSFGDGKKRETRQNKLQQRVKVPYLRCQRDGQGGSHFGGIHNPYVFLVTWTAEPVPNGGRVGTNNVRDKTHRVCRPAVHGHMGIFPTSSRGISIVRRVSAGRYGVETRSRQRTFELWRKAAGSMPRKASTESGQTIACPFAGQIRTNPPSLMTQVLWARVAGRRRTRPPDVETLHTRIKFKTDRGKTYTKGGYRVHTKLFMANICVKTGGGGGKRRKGTALHPR